MATSYRITGVVGIPDKSGNIVEKRKVITTAHSRQEAIAHVRRLEKDPSSTFANVRIEPVSESSQKDEPINRLERDTAAAKSAARRGRIG